MTGACLGNCFLAGGSDPGSPDAPVRFGFTGVQASCRGGALSVSGVFGGELCGRSTLSTAEDSTENNSATEVLGFCVEQ